MLEFCVGLHGDDKGLLVLGAATGLAAVSLTAQIRIVDLHETMESPRCFALGHRLHHLVLEPPRGPIRHTQGTLELSAAIFVLVAVNR